MSDSGLLPVMCLLGPTAAGKTDIAIDLIKRLPLEIISVDSAQVYRQMDIGTAKPDAEVLKRAPHALIDVVDPWQSYSVARFLKDADHEIKRIHRQKKIPLLAGGTMLYFRSLWDGLSNLPESDATVRQRWLNYLAEHGQDALYQQLQQVDPIIADKIHSNDPQRIMRALEVHDITGETLSSLQNKRAPEQSYDFYNLGLFPNDRALLHERIAQRFAIMLEQGFESEVESLMNLSQMNSDLPSMRSVGYRQMCQYLANGCDKQQMTDQSLAATRQLAKRQITWLRGMDSCRMVDPFAESVTLVDDTLARWVASGLENLSSAP